jgi:hypothetical protein
VRVRSRRFDRQLDDALLAIAAATGALYVRRKLRRLLSRAVVLGELLALAGALGAAGAVGLWLRRRNTGS